MTEKIPVVSSVIRAAEYDKDNKTLVLTFNNNKAYNYTNVDGYTWEMFKASPSKGRFYSMNIKGKFK